MSTSVFPTAPKSGCPKCGHLYGFSGISPRYESDPDFGERLIWHCRSCGYRTDTAVVTPDEHYAGLPGRPR